MKIPGQHINIIIRRRLGFPYTRAWLKSIITTALNAENNPSPIEINCLITDDENIRKFNRRYRGIDDTTDVLSFALAECSSGSAAVDFPTVPGDSGKYGDIIISYQRAVVQAGKLGHSVKAELTLLLVHGTLHLLGYDHRTAYEAKKMEARERAIIKAINEGEEKK